MRRDNQDGSVTIGGIISKEPEQRAAGDKSVVKFSIRYTPANAERDERGYKKSTFIDVDVWDSQAMFLQKGDHVEITGQLSQREYNGKTYVSLRSEYIVPAMDVIGRLMTKAASAAAEAKTEDFPELPDDGGLPF